MTAIPSSEALRSEIDAVAAEFDAVAPAYQATVEDSIGFIGKGLEFFTQAKVAHMIDLGTRLLGDLADVSVLDIGCGNGTTDALVAPLVRRLHGVDTSSEMTTLAKRNNPSGEYHHYDGLTLPFDDATFDLTFAICVMHHVPPVQWDTFADEMFRVTRPGGLMMVFDHNPFNPLTRRAVGRCPFDADAVLLGRGRVAGVLRHAGAELAAERYIVFAPVGGARFHRAERLVGWLPLGAQYVVACRRPGVRAHSSTNVAP